LDQRRLLHTAIHCRSLQEGHAVRPDLYPAGECVSQQDRISLCIQEALHTLISIVFMRNLEISNFFVFCCNNKHWHRTIFSEISWHIFSLEIRYGHCNRILSKTFKNPFEDENTWRCGEVGMKIKEFCKQKADFLCVIVITELVIILALLGYWFYNHVFATPVGAG